jgi:hypothetical protein
MTPAEAYETRERKQSLFQISDDPFAAVAGGHRQSVSGVASSASAAATRRRSSAVAPDADASYATHSGYSMGDKLAPIESRPEGPPDVGSSRVNNHTLTSAGSELSDATTSHGSANGEHARFHDAVTTGHDHTADNDPDSVAPHEMR